MTDDDRKAYNREQKARRRAEQRERAPEVVEERSAPARPAYSFEDEVDEFEDLPEMRLLHAIHDAIEVWREWSAVSDFDGPDAARLSDIDLKIADKLADAVADIARTELADTRTELADKAADNADKPRTLDRSVSLFSRSRTDQREVGPLTARGAPSPRTGDADNADADSRTASAIVAALDARLASIALVQVEILDRLDALDRRDSSDDR